MKGFSLKERLRYAFDNTMSRGAGALIAWLAVLSLVIILAVALVVWLAGLAPDTGFVELSWMALMRTLDAGTMGGDQGSWPFLIAMLAVTLGGIFVISTLIGVLTTGIEAKLDSLRKGRSKIAERNHTVILGWSEQIFTILPELVEANKNQRRGCVAIMADRDKVEMEDEIRDKVGDTRKTRVVCRRGQPMDLGDLDIVGIHSSRSIIVLAPPDSPNPDADVIKTMLAITNHPNRRQEPYHIVAEIYDPKNMEAAKLAGGNEAEIILVADFIARVVAQTCRQSGLSVVYTELLDFGGDEIYFQEPEPELIGKAFGEVLPVYAESTIIGLVPAEGEPGLNPPHQTPISPGDRLIVIAEDDDTTRLSGLTELGIDEGAISSTPQAQAKPEKTLILGWNQRATAIIRELNSYVAPGSAVTVAAEVKEGKEELVKHCAVWKNLKVGFVHANTTDRRTLEGLRPESYDHLILLSYSDTLTSQEADARTLITLLHLRHMAEKSGRKFSVVSEMLDIRNRNLAEVARADDFIVSDKLVSLMLAQVSENKYLNAVFTDVFAPEGSEIYLKPAENFILLGRPVNFYTVLESARRQGALAIGYKLAALSADAGRSYGVVVNPKNKLDKISFAPGDKIVVVAED